MPVQSEDNSDNYLSKMFAFPVNAIDLYNATYHYFYLKSNLLMFYFFFFTFSIEPLEAFTFDLVFWIVLFIDDTKCANSET